MTATAVSRIDASTVAAIGGWEREEVALLKEQIAPEATDAELALLARYCKATGLDPFRGQIFGIVRTDRRATRGKKMTIQVGIDGLRLLAARTGLYEGTASEQWCGPDGAWRDVWLEDGPPAAARVGVFRKGAREPIYAVATWRSYAQRSREGTLVGMWATMGAEQLAKCAEAKALRRGFPDETSGLYVEEEPYADGPGDGREPDQRTGRDSASQAPQVRVVVEPEPAAVSVEAELAGIARDQAAQLSPDERAQLRRLCADLGVQPTASGLVGLLGQDVRDLRGFIARQLAAKPPAEPPAAEPGPEPPPAEPAPSPSPPAGPNAPQSGGASAAREPQGVAGVETPPEALRIDHVGAAISRLTPAERADLAELAYELGWAPVGARVSTHLVLQCLGNDSLDVDSLRRAIQGLRELLAEQAAAEARGREQAAEEVAPADVSVEDPPRRPGAEAADFQGWLDRGAQPAAPDGQETLL